MKKAVIVFLLLCTAAPVGLAQSVTVYYHSKDLTSDTVICHNLNEQDYKTLKGIRKKPRFVFKDCDGIFRTKRKRMDLSENDTTEKLSYFNKADCKWDKATIKLQVKDTCDEKSVPAATATIEESCSKDKERLRRVYNKKGTALLVFDECSKDSYLIDARNRRRKGRFIWPREQLIVEVRNANILKYKYNVGSETIAYHVEAETKEKPEEKVRETVTKEAKDTAKLDTIPLNNLYRTMNSATWKKNELADAECINGESLNAFIRAGNEGLRDFGIYDYKNTRADFTFWARQNWSRIPEVDRDRISIKGNSDSLRAEFLDRLDTMAVTLSGLQRAAANTVLRQYPLYVNGRNADILRVNFRRDPRISGSGSGFDIDYDLDVRGLKIDVSAGLFLSGLADEKYYLKRDSVGDTTRNVIMLENPKALSLSVGTTVNVNYRFCSVVSSGVSVGTALPFNKESVNPQILLGVNFLFGREQRVGITAGGVFGWRQVLRHGYEEGDVYEIDSNVPVTTNTGISWYAGIVYNLGKTKLSDGLTAKE